MGLIHGTSGRKTSPPSSLRAILRPLISP
ncbi:rCG62175 [Rattus norvegicus]|uniref:RCG57462 n=1 Tax=Rattus norvegicus TaxID=10116 RepID=A6H9M9_RAT|nr:rCG57462 [Rattus norvegicus]EDM02734.1 rCG62175 [Rattus norvegicus]